MLLQSKVFILVLLQGFFLAKLAESVPISSCQKDEKCTRLVRCSPLMNILKPRGMTQAEKDVFAHRQCGLGPNGRELLHRVYVCCPELGDVLPNNQTCGRTTSVLRSPGAENIEINEYPWMGVLLYENRLSFTSDQRTGCVGSLINSRYVLTAAHCVTGGYLTRNDLVVKSVRLGEHNTSSNPECGGHSCAPQHHYDIALLRLRFPVRYTKRIQPICLPDAGTHLLGLNLRIAGWNPTESSHPLITSTIKERNPHYCSNTYPHFHAASQICAGGQRERDTCAGISGSPLMGIMARGLDQFAFLAGIASYGQQHCYAAGTPAVYTNTGHFLEWIRANLAP